MKTAVELIREATVGTPYEGRLYLVGGIVRDEVMGLPVDEDVDIVLEGSASHLALFLHGKGLSDHYPVTYPRFGTAMVTLGGRKVEIVGARAESYCADSRKPEVRPTSLLDDVLRRDFTINTLLKNIHTGEIQDLTGKAFADIRSGAIRTPLDPLRTFEDDPLRMLRAVRFAARFGFGIEPDALAAISERASRLKIISGERIRDEVIKTLMTSRPELGFDLMRETGMLEAFAPELAAMYGVEQNEFHLYDVWKHTMKTVEAIPTEAGLTLRLTALLHDIGKPSTKTIDDLGRAHFYQHQSVGADMAGGLLRRLRFPNSEIDAVCFMIRMHLRVGEYDELWTDAAIRRLIRDSGPFLDDLILLTEADKAASNTEMPGADMVKLREHMGRVLESLQGEIESPLSGSEIMQELDLEPGKQVGEIKEYLVTQVLEGNLAPGDKVKAKLLVSEAFGRRG